MSNNARPYCVWCGSTTEALTRIPDALAAPGEWAWCCEDRVACARREAGVEGALNQPWATHTAKRSPWWRRFATKGSRS